LAESTPTTLTGELTTPWRTAKPRSLWGDTARTFARNKAGMAGLVVACLVMLIAILAPWVAPYDHLEQDWDHLREPPSAAHLMGTDAVGRDLLSRVLMGIRTAVLVAVIVTFTTAVVGVLVGAMGALIGRWVDAIVVWVMDGLLNFPTLWLAAFINVLTRPTIRRVARQIYESTHWNWLQDPVALDYLVMFGCLSFVWWAGLGRLVRGQVLSLREKEFIEAQRAIGASPWWVTTRHLVPNVLGQVIVQMSTGFGRAMLAESSLSFLGIGIRPPGASLGKMIFDGTATWRSDPHLVAMPGLTLAIIIMSFVFVGDALNDALNPRVRER
jgi:ABC-type dipeptide/oligopeptide/nickel transport system permease subunit